ncbi:polyamine ABC transporter substrate-binding protein [Nocardioides mesophilus]|uniref:Spermidine/putrescine ABC transporter substrate-binding protein n=1 Tax=Nocardioides mesophilus TaxID=433659 RepID=A0A7G9R978_9ACTN|nr:spermidine/putrescine ABC transporter substrate-binding protein [Nocardioides mesophilus]QNN52153.1 spermidine/putrescine ABC transporter substrate-binding protein [Nocardioides mesophilus]
MSQTDAHLRELLRATTGRGVSRRGFLRGAGLAGLAVGAPNLLAACGTQGAKQAAGECVSKDLSATEKKMKFSNWPLYIDEKRVKQGGSKVTVYPTLQKFEDQTGITVDYVTDINDNNEFFGIVRNQLADCQSTGRDMFALTDYMAARMIDLGWIQELDKANMPNVEANLSESLRSPSWDPERKYSAPWQSGLTGIAYNADLTGEVKSFDELLTRSDLKGKVSLLSEMHDTMLFMLLLEGADPADFTADEYAAAIERLDKSVQAGQIRAFTGNEYAQDLSKGNIVACEAWSGDIIQLQFDNPNIKFIAPEEGLAIWSDNMIVPNKATHKANAEKWMDFYYQPEIAAELAAWVNYICPVDGAKQAMEKIDPSLVDNELIFPGQDLLAKTYSMMGLDSKTEQDYQQQFAAVTGA